MIAWTCYHDMTAAASLAVVRLHFEQLFRLGCPSSLGRDLSSLEVSNVALGARQPYTTAGHPQAAAPLSGAGKARGFVYCPCSLMLPPARPDFTHLRLARATARLPESLPGRAATRSGFTGPGAGAYSEPGFQVTRLARAANKLPSYFSCRRRPDPS